MVDCYNCRFFKEDYNDNFMCMKHNKDVSDYDEIDCEDFEEHMSCDTCEYCKVVVYETGTIDDIEHRCKLQNNKIIYDDLSPLRAHNYDFPPCPIGRYSRIM